MTSLIANLKGQHNKLVKRYNDLLVNNAHQAKSLSIKIATLSRQIHDLDKKHQDSIQKQALVKNKNYL
jgi:hypothetical protein